MKIYVIKGIRDGNLSTLLVTTNLEKAKAFIITDGWEIEVWENEVHIQDINYHEDSGFLAWEIK